MLPPFVDHLPERVTRAALPTPFPVGTVNAWLLADPPVTLVDPGVLGAESTEALDALLAGAGRQMRDVEQIVVTHAHPDHFGAAATVAAHAGATVICARAELPALLGQDDVDRRSALLTMLGAPPDVVATDAAARAGLRHLVTYPSAADVRVVDDGQHLDAGGRRMTALVSAGHATGHLCLWDAEGGVLWSGDHLLGRIVPIAALEPDGSENLRAPALLDYLATLERYVDLAPDVVLPGHGKPFTAIDVLERRLRTHHAERADAVEAILRDFGTATAWDVTTRLLWQPDGYRAVLGIAEVATHLDLLEAARRVEHHEVDGRFEYRVLDRPSPVARAVRQRCDRRAWPNSRAYLQRTIRDLDVLARRAAQP